MVELYNSGNPRAEQFREYELTPSALFAWIKKYNNTGSFDIDDNRSDEKSTDQTPQGRSATEDGK